MPQAIGNLSETMVTAIIGATTVQQRWTISIAEEKNTRKAKGGKLLNSSDGEGSEAAAESEGASRQRGGGDC